MAGVLYLVSTPIGNLGDISFRAVEVLKEVDLIATENRRLTLRLLQRFGVGTRVVSYREENRNRTIPALLAKLEEGRSVALCADAGTPAVSDPGYHLVRAAIDAGFQVVPLPGPIAAVAALTASGLPTDRFLFVGFLPAKPGPREAVLTELADCPWTLVFYEAPHRLRETLDAMERVLGDREAAVARELTKVHEEFRRGSFSALKVEMGEAEEEGRLRGEFVLVVRGADRADRVPVQEQRAEEARDLAALLVREGLGTRSAARVLERIHGLSRNRAYEIILAVQEDR